MFLSLLGIAPALTALNAQTSFNSAVVKTYGLFELFLKGDFPFENPYDYSANVMTVYYTSPDGKTFKTDGFFVKKEGDEAFVSRFTPAVSGVWKYKVELRSEGRVIFRDSSGSFECTKEKQGQGFVGVSTRDPLFFEFKDSKEPFFAVGQSLCWSTGSVMEDYERWMQRLSENGVNFIRIWMAPWSFGLETEALKDYGHRETQMKMLDEIIKMGEEKGIYIMLCFLAHGEFSLDYNSEWKNNPYNREKGGMLEVPGEFFASKEAFETYRNRIRYICARWGYSPNVMAYEAINEAELTHNYSARIMKSWHKKVFDEIKKYDIYGKLLTTSFSGDLKEESIWKMKEVDFTQTHIYFLRDAAVEIFDVSKKKIREFSKPHIVSEFGIDIYDDFAKKGKDPRGLHIHNAVWAGAFSLSAGTPMTWWWDVYVDELDLYGIYGRLARFLEGIIWGRGDFYEMENPDIRVKNPGDEAGNIVVTAKNRWVEPAARKYFVRTDGRVINSEDFFSYVSGEENAQVFVTRNPVPGRAVIRISGLQGDSLLEIKVNEQVVLEENLSAKDSGGSLNEKEGRYEADVERAFYIELGVGANETAIVNKGPGNIILYGIEFENHRGASYPGVFVSGMQSKRAAYAWIKNSRSTWENAEPGMVAETEFRIRGLDTARYLIRVYDTHKGEYILEKQEIMDTGILKIELPAFERDIALRVERYVDVRE